MVLHTLVTHQSRQVPLSERIGRMHWRRYRRGLVTIPIIVAASFAGWLLGGGGYFWPRWVLLWGGVALALRASLAFRSDPPRSATNIDRRRFLKSADGGVLAGARNRTASERRHRDEPGRSEDDLHTGARYGVERPEAVLSISSSI